MLPLSVGSIRTVRRAGLQTGHGTAGEAWLREFEPLVFAELGFYASHSFSAVGSVPAEPPQE